MYQTILVPLDGSKRAEAILPHVFNLATHFQANIIFLRVIEPEPLLIGPDIVYPIVNQQVVEEQTRQAKTYLENLKADWQKQNISATTHIAHGPVVEEIINCARRNQADLIAMASHGRTGLAQVFYGSVAAGVLHRVDRPLLLIRAKNNE